MTVTKTIISTTDAVPPLPVFSQAVISKGNVYVSGNIGCTKELKLVEGGIRAQTRAALENIAIVLKAAGTGLKHIVKVNIYLSNLPRDFPAMNEIYHTYAGEQCDISNSSLTKIPSLREVALELQAYLWVQM
ncbi:hypothetical protein H0H87_010485 [Tephrocybe sp. NHM501043]|nr:hypothetical protein H0H87_010485 [Tephrocybe sp. NHM501043]